MPYFGLPAPCEAQGYLLVFNETVFIDFIIADQSNVQSITINHLLAQKFPVRLQDERDKFCPVALSKELLSFAAQMGSWRHTGHRPEDIATTVQRVRPDEPTAADRHRRWHLQRHANEERAVVICNLKRQRAAPDGTWKGDVFFIFIER